MDLPMETREIRDAGAGRRDITETSAGRKACKAMDLMGGLIACVRLRQRHRPRLGLDQLAVMTAPRTAEGTGP